LLTQINEFLLNAKAGSVIEYSELYDRNHLAADYADQRRF